MGFGGLALLQDHVAKGWVTCATPLALEFEICTHGFDAVTAGDIAKSKYYGSVCASLLIEIPAHPLIAPAPPTSSNSLSGGPNPKPQPPETLNPKHPYPTYCARQLSLSPREPQ